MLLLYMWLVLRATHIAPQLQTHKTQLQSGAKSNFKTILKHPISFRIGSKSGEGEITDSAAVPFYYAGSIQCRWESNFELPAHTNCMSNIEKKDLRALETGSKGRIVHLMKTRRNMSTSTPPHGISMNPWKVDEEFSATSTSTSHINNFAKKIPHSACT